MIFDRPAVEFEEAWGVYVLFLFIFMYTKDTRWYLYEL